MNNPDEFSPDFIKGQRDCQNGVPHGAGNPEAYDRGYAAQYQHEQNMSNLTAMQQGGHK